MNSFSGISTCCVAVILLTSCGDDAQNSMEGQQLEPSTIVQERVVREEQRSLTEGYAAFRKSQIADVNYHLSLQLDESDIFSGQVEITFDLSVGNVSPVTVDYDNGDILGITVNGEPADYAYEHWFVSLPPEQFTAGRNTLLIDYSRPYATDGAGLHKFTDPENGEIYLYTNFEPYDANRLFPHFDQPNLKAPLTLDVLAPAPWQVIANTRETSITGQGERRLWAFPATASISSYVYAMHAGPFSVWEDQTGDIPLRLFARNSLATYVKTEEWFTPTQQSFGFFQDYFEVPYPFGKYDQVIVPDFNPGAMENVGAVTFNERYISRGEKTTAQRLNLAYVIAHEMAHMWFGDLVTMDWWNGIWLNESFATYMAYLELEHASDFENTWDNFYSGTKQGAYVADQRVTTHPIEQAVATTADAFTNFDGIAYGKGGSVLKQLPYFIGEENFRQGVSAYLKKYAYQNTSLGDFVGELGLAAGQDLNQWQQEWLYQSGVNTLEPAFTCESGTLTSLQLLQSEPEVAAADRVLRSQRTQVALYRYTDEEMIPGETIPVIYSGAVTDVPEAIGQPCPDLVFPNEEDWAYVKVQLDDTSLATLNEHINDFPDASTRIMLWQSLWDSVRDARLPLTSFVDKAMANIGAESDQNIVRQVSGNLLTAFNLFSRIDSGNPDYANSKRLIEAYAWEQLNAASPGGDLQKIWFATFTASAHTAQALDYLLELLSGSDSIEGLEIDQDKRWDIIIALNRYEYGDYAALLDAERARDNSDLGSNMALAAEAIRPQAEVKEHWLDIIINEPETYKLATMRTLMANLFTAEQTQLAEDYADRIISAVPDINAEGSEGFVDEYANILTPATCTEDSVARLQQANEDFAGFHPLIIKAYLVQHQEDQRCLAIRELLQ